MKYSLFALIMTVAGLAAALVLKWPMLIWLLLGLVFLSFTIMAFLGYHSVPCWLMLLGLFCLSAFYFAWRQEIYTARLDGNRGFNQMPVVVEGIVVTRFEAMSGGQCRFTIKTTPAPIPAPMGRLVVYYKGAMPETCYGTRMRLAGKFRLLRETKDIIPGFYEMHGITGQMTVTAPPLQLSQPGLAWWRIWAEQSRRSLAEFGRRCLRPDEYQLLNGMVFGENLPDDLAGQQLKLEFRRTGTIHLLSVSGLHVGFIVLVLNLLLAWCRIPKRWRMLPLALGVWFYIMMTGMEAPILRAGIMLLISISGQMVGAEDDPVNRLCLAGWILLGINPYNLFDPGFQLSFTATLGVVWLYPVLKKMFPLKCRWLNLLWQVILVSIGAQLCFIPITVHYFQQISWGSPLVNLLLFLPAQYVVIGGFAGELIGLILPGLGRLILITVGWNLELIEAIVRFCSEFPWVSGWSPIWPWPWMVGYYLGLFLLLDCFRPSLLDGRRNINMPAVLLLALILANGLVWAGFSYQATRNCLQVFFIDVGQGDAILLRGPYGGTVLIDAGDDGRGRSRVLPVLRQNGIDHLDLVLGTHGHRDHLGGMDEVLGEVAASALYLPSSTDLKASAVRQTRIELQRLGIPIRKTGNGARFKIDGLAEGEIFCDPEAASDNDRSLVVLIHYGKNKLLLTGDLGSKGEMNIKNYATRLRAVGLKIGHHGSNLASTMPFLTQVRPNFAVISVGEGNRFGHPGPQALRRLNSLGIRIFRTDCHGLIRLRMYPDKTIVIPAKGG